MKPVPSEETLFAAALQRPTPDARRAFLDEACRDQPALRERLDSLLRAAEGVGGFLEQPPAALVAGIPEANESEVTEKPGDRIGRYNLLQKIGEGGCGVVYMAEQEEPVRRRVALKVIKLGMDTRQVVARFEAERQALALMDHPNIARVLDAGATVTGRPYFVMELVRGTRITDYCDQEHLSTEARLELFTQVCRAVQHAHQKGIIHRDLKPSNVLVTMNDGASVPKIIDFGIAKATDRRLTDKTCFTEFHAFIGTPAYTSPEQAEMSSLDIDTRSDIYSLGVLLYELLTGRTPFNGQNLLNAGLDEMRRIIREEDPPRPSARLSTLGVKETAELVRARRIKIPELARSLEGDLDWIVMKCLEKDRTRRYDTVGVLAMDIERHLHDEPVIACPPRATYRFRKWVRRNKLAFTAGATVLTALVAGIATTSWMYWQKQGALSWALTAEQAAKAESATSKKVTKILSEMLKIVEPARARGRDTTLVREMIDDTVQRIRRSLTNEPLVEAELRNNLAWAYHEMREYERCEEMGREIVRLVEPVKGRKHNLVRIGLQWQAVPLFELGRYQQAEAIFRELAAGRPEGGYDNMRVLALGNLVLVFTRQGRSEEAEVCAREAQRVYVKYTGEESPQVVDHLAEMHYNRGDYDAADELDHKALALARKLFKAGGAVERTILWQLGSTALRRNDFVQAEAYLRQVTNALSTYYKKPSLDAVASDLAELYGRQGRYAESEALYREILTRQRAHLKPDDDDIVETITCLGQTLARPAWAWIDQMCAAPAGGVSRSPQPAPSLEPLKEAERLLRDGLAKRQATPKPFDVRLARTKARLGAALAAAVLSQPASADSAWRSRLAEAQWLLEEAHAALQQDRAAHWHHRREVIDDLARFYAAWHTLDPRAGQGAKAAEWKCRLAEFEAARPGRKPSTL